MYIDICNKYKTEQLKGGFIFNSASHEWCGKVSKVRLVCAWKLQLTFIERN